MKGKEPANVHQKRSMENLATYVLRALFSQETMEYFPVEVKSFIMPKTTPHKDGEPLGWLLISEYSLLVP
jgi:hypothetical protein